MVRGTACLIGALVLAAALGPSQAHAGKAPLSLRASKSEDGPYEVFSRVGIKQGQQKTTWWRVKNKSAGDQAPASLSDLASPIPGYKVQWFRGNENISAEVKGAGYEFDLAAGQSKYFSSRIKRVGPEGDACLDARVRDENQTVAGDAVMGVNTNQCAL